VKNAYALSPEFHRQLWLRFSPFRLAAPPLLVGLGTFATANFPKEMFGLTQVNTAATMYLMLGVYGLVVILWGTYAAATAVQDELRDNTWDFQRMSSITPVQLALGKLFGATSFTWYFGLLALVVAGFSYWNYHAPESLYNKMDVSGAYDPGDDTLYVVFRLAAAGIIAHALAFLYSFADSVILFGRGGRSRPPRGILGFLLGAMAGYGICWHTIREEAMHLRPRTLLEAQDFQIHWYGQDFSRHGFIVLSLLFFIAWFLAGSCRLARTELSYRTLPWAWPAFVAAVIAWNCGFSMRPATEGSGPNWFFVLFSAFKQALGAAYVVMVVEAADLRRYARLAFYAKKTDVPRALENLPAWLATMPLVILLFFGVMATAANEGTRYDLGHVTAFMVSVLLFMARDGAVVHGIHITFKGRGTAFAILFYYLIAYWLLPLVSFTSVKLNLGDIVRGVVNFTVPEEITNIAGAFYPTAMLNPALSLFAVTVEAAAAAAWLYSRLRRMRRPAQKASA
jgi:hypothetical protein